MRMFVCQITNQMVKSCKTYLTDDGLLKIWDKPLQQTYAKISVCIHLYEQYRKAFYSVKTKIEAAPKERHFDFSEMYIFGKFEAFCKRLEKVCKCLLRDIPIKCYVDMFKFNRFILLQ